MSVYGSTREQDIKELIQRLKKIYKFRDLGQLQYFLDIYIIHNIDNRRIYICQDSYVDKRIKHYKIDTSSKPPSTPVSHNQDLIKYESEAHTERIRMYQKKVGSISYPANITHPDIAKTASKLAEFLVNPVPEHEKAADHCLQYLATTKFPAIEYTALGDGELTAQVPNEELQIFKNTANASFANGADCRSAEGYTFKLFGGCIDWAVQKQATVSTSTTEAELLTLLF
ncbi:MAG: hypothetical protein FRX48_07184 [Lasallia pustulata]|uniref:Reverse transcriptase Ty1/copia-type domain-containing protein n=1 Tax=Lasallia pustulata TaxID=136370 RepID=A0A5M8PIV1_9LECA|nr:MAG: hypothetical protein FRX48_07184 [Lasallia pustulata]